MPREDRLRIYKELLDLRGALPVSVFSNEFDVSLPTAWRDLKELVASGDVEAVGSGRGTKYRLVKNYDQAIRVPLGLDSWDIDDYVNSPLATRKPVGYRHEFLNEYVPNASRYLPHHITERLCQVGDLKSQEFDASRTDQRVRRFAIDVSYGSSRLEGISTTYLETERLVELGRTTASVEERRDTAMILNHKDAIQFVLDNRSDDTSYMPMGFNRSTVQHIHSLLLSDIHPDVEEVGNPRLRDVSIAGSTYHPLSIPTEVTETLERVLEKCDRINDPFEQSFFALVHLAYLQPFADGNKRTSRLMANIPLLKADLCPISFLATPSRAYTSGLLGVYELNRVEMLRDVYVSSYEQSAHRLHQDKDRQVAPSVLELQYRGLIDDMVRDIILNAQDGSYIDAIRRNIDVFTELTTYQKREVLEVTLEKARKSPVTTMRRYGVSPDEYIAWDEKRPVYLNIESIPLASERVQDG